MIKRALGSTGLQVSALGLGCNNFGGRLDPERTRLVVDAAIVAGITFIDTADTYGNRGGSERLLGETLGNRRKDVMLATKFGLPMDETGRLKGASRAYVMTAVEESLKRRSCFAGSAGAQSKRQIGGCFHQGRDEEGNCPALC